MDDVSFLSRYIVRILSITILLGFFCYFISFFVYEFYDTSFGPNGRAFSQKVRLEREYCSRFNMLTVDRLPVLCLDFYNL